MGGTPLLGGSWGPILQLDMENWIEFLEVLNLPYNILDFVQGPFFPDDLLKITSGQSMECGITKLEVGSGSTSI